MMLEREDYRVLFRVFLALSIFFGVCLIIFTIYFQIENTRLTDDYNAINNKYYQSLVPPYIAVDNKTVLIVFKRTDNSIDGWQVPFATLENNIERGLLLRDVVPIVVKIEKNFCSEILSSSLCSYYDCNEFAENCIKDIKDFSSPNYSVQYLTLKNDNNESFVVVDFRPFVDFSTFGKVIPELYNQSKNEKEFIGEVWNIVTQLVVYSSGNETTQVPKYPIETFLSGGGVCADTAVLFASMIKAAPTNWTVSFIYLDANNPENPIKPNHLMVKIETENDTYLIDTTQNKNMEPYKTINGWFYKI